MKPILSQPSSNQAGIASKVLKELDCSHNQTFVLKAPEYEDKDLNPADKRHTMSCSATRQMELAGIGNWDD